MGEEEEEEEGVSAAGFGEAEVEVEVEVYRACVGTGQRWVVALWMWTGCIAAVWRVRCAALGAIALLADSVALASRRQAAHR